MKRLVLIQFVVLLAGAIFAWVNFFLELADWLNHRACTIGCPVTQIKNPFFTPCFWGAVFFTVAFVLNILILKAKEV